MRPVHIVEQKINPFEFFKSLILYYISAKNIAADHSQQSINQSSLIRFCVVSTIFVLQSLMCVCILIVL